MDTISPVYRCDHDRDCRPLQAGDWSTPQPGTAFYAPLSLLFQVDRRSEATRSDRLTAYTARLAHQCDGQAMPADLAQLGKDAIHFYMLMTADFEDAPARPTDVQIAEAKARHPDGIPF